MEGIITIELAIFTGQVCLNLIGDDHFENRYCQGILQNISRNLCRCPVKRGDLNRLIKRHFTIYKTGNRDPSYSSPRNVVAELEEVIISRGD